MDRTAVVERALRNAFPHTLLSTLRTEMARHYGATTVEVSMVDYGMTTLQAVSDVAGHPEPGAVSVHDSAPGRAFGSQQPHVVNDGSTGEVIVHVPVSVRGDRLGVLSVCLPRDRYRAELQDEFQDIAEGLGHEILVAERDTDIFVKARRIARLTLAAEMQWQLLPGRACIRPEYALGGQLEPAYAVFGDSFDWSASEEHLTLTLTNGMGNGIDAALLSTLGTNALRNARRAGLGLTEQASLADQAIYGQHRGEAYLTVLLLRFALASGEVEVIDAGSPRGWRLRDKVVTPLDFEAQLPLGMFEDTAYTTERFTVQPGDRLLFVSDGVYEAPSPSGEPYGEGALSRLLSATRLLPATQVPQAVLREVATHRGDRETLDDALVVCLDWFGRTTRVMPAEA